MVHSLALSLTLGLASQVATAAPEVGALAPLFTAQLHDGSVFKLENQKGKGWTVLYFYPKAGTPGCTKQACAFRDAIDLIKAKNAIVLGISNDTVAAQAKFHGEHKLNFPLAADEDGKIIEAFGTKMPLISMAKRWTYLVDPDLRIRAIEKDVDPALDAQRVAQKLQELQDADTKRK